MVGRCDAVLTGSPCRRSSEPGGATPHKDLGHQRRPIQGVLKKIGKKKARRGAFLLDLKKKKNLILKELGERSPFLVSALSLVKF